MRSKIKSGKEILDDFFSGLPKIAGVDKRIANTFFELYTAGKLTNTNISNALAKLRERNETDND